MDLMDFLLRPLGISNRHLSKIKIERYHEMETTTNKYREDAYIVACNAKSSSLETG
jgi:hypothetical protein